MELDKDLQFVLDKMGYGLSSEHINQPMTKEDLERLLNWPEDNYKKLPEWEWNEWSRKTHCALQVAFSHDTLREQDKTKIIEWRKRFMSVIQNALSKDVGSRIILEGAAFDFLKKDLLPKAIHYFGYKKLTEEEQRVIDVFTPRYKMIKGFLKIILVLLLISILYYFFV